MSSFTTQLHVHPLDDGKSWEIDEDFTYYVGELDSNSFVTVPVGFVTDFASVPWFMWWLLPPWGKYGKAAVIHDYLWKGHTMMIDGQAKSVTRQVSNLIFLEAMGVLDVNVVVRYPMYWAVCANALLKDTIDKVKAKFKKD